MQDHIQAPPRADKLSGGQFETDTNHADSTQRGEIPLGGTDRWRCESSFLSACLMEGAEKGATSVGAGKGIWFPRE